MKMCLLTRTMAIALVASFVVATSFAFSPASRTTSVSRIQSFTRKTTFLAAEEVIGGSDALTDKLADAASGAIGDTPLAEVAETVVRKAPNMGILPNPDGTIPPFESVIPTLDTISLVAGQENYGLAIVCVGEAIWSFLKAPSLEHAKVLVPAALAALILVVVSGPMVTSGDPASVSLGLEIATGVSVLLGASYVARLLAPFSPSPKEIAFLGLLVSIAGFFSFGQNLLVDGFVTLPSLPSIPMPSLPF